MSLKARRRLVRCYHETLQCDEDIVSLQRFSNAQLVAIEKVLKSYAKWTGSSTLQLRFWSAVRSHPRRLSKCDLSGLEFQYADVQTKLRIAFPDGFSDDTFSIADSAVPPVPLGNKHLLLSGSPGYWNEYDCASDTPPGQDGCYSSSIYSSSDSEASGSNGVSHQQSLASERFGPYGTTNTSSFTSSSSSFIAENNSGPAQTNKPVDTHATQNTASAKALTLGSLFMLCCIKARKSQDTRAAGFAVASV